MSGWIGATLLAIGFLVILKLSRLDKLARNVITVAQESVAAMGNPELADIEKERLLQRNALRLFGYALYIIAGATAALLVPVGVLWCTERVGLLPLAPALDVAASPAFLIGASVAGTAAWLLWSRAAGKKAETASPDYSAIDRLFHTVAFGTYPAQVPLARLETRLYKKTLARQSVERPVFIAGLPRAGTTLLLECCVASPEFASHCYRDMPFVPVPLLWNSFTRRFGKTGEKRERAHADGMQIDVDSPEALEEVLWLLFWANHYQKNRVIPWTHDERHEEFVAFFTDHMRKIVALRCGAEATTGRYISKNNMNISRTRWLRERFPDAVLLIPFRDPVQSAASLLRQHRNFLAMHARDTFAATYMRAIGHFEFGVNIKPIDFDAWLAKRQCESYETLGFWLEYWHAAYRHLSAQDANLTFFDYERFCANGTAGLRDLATLTGSTHANVLQQKADDLHAPVARERDLGAVPPDVLDSARKMHAELRKRANATMPASTRTRTTGGSSG